MRFTQIDQRGDKVHVVTKKDGTVIRDVTVEIGSRYIVSPFNKQKKKHRDKIGVVTGHSADPSKGQFGVKIRFDQTGGIGFVPYEDLDVPPGA